MLLVRRFKAKINLRMENIIAVVLTLLGSYTALFNAGFDGGKALT